MKTKCICNLTDHAHTLECLCQEDWTTNDGCSNSSPRYVFLADEISRIIRSSAHALICGDSAGVGRLIVSSLAHRYGVEPTLTLEEMVAERDGQ